MKMKIEDIGTAPFDLISDVADIFRILKIKSKKRRGRR